MPGMKIVKDKEKIYVDELKKMATKMFDNLVKAVVDIEKRVIVLDAEMHADEERLLLERGSKQENLWGINLYPERQDDDWIEFDSMINLRPSCGNRSRGVEDQNLRKLIIEIINNLVAK